MSSWKKLIEMIDEAGRLGPQSTVTLVMDADESFALEDLFNWAKSKKGSPFDGDGREELEKLHKKLVDKQHRSLDYKTGGQMMQQIRAKHANDPVDKNRLHVSRGGNYDPSKMMRKK